MSDKEVLSQRTNSGFTRILQRLTAVKNWCQGLVNSEATARVGLKTELLGEIAKKQNTLSFDSTPTENSTNPVTSAGVKTAIANALEEAKRTFQFRFMGQIINSAIPITDTAVYPLDGTQMFVNGGYSDFINYIRGKITSNPELFLSEEEWQETVEQYGTCSKFVFVEGNYLRVPKMVADESYITVKGVHDTDRYLIESGHSDTEWYNLYSDGWLEQGGKTTASNVNLKVVSFEAGFGKIYKDTTYTITLGTSYTTTATYTPLVQNSTKTATGFKIYDSTNTAVYSYWRTDGYADPSIMPEKNLLKTKYSYIVVSTFNVPQVEGNIEIEKFITDLRTLNQTKLDKNLSNLPDNIVYIIKTYRDSNGSWYRVYSDGWCEQGGIYNVNVAAFNVLIKFHIPFTIDLPQVMLGRSGTTAFASDTATGSVSVDTITYRSVQTNRITKESFYLGRQPTNGGSSGAISIWEAKGPIDLNNLPQ